MGDWAAKWRTWGNPLLLTGALSACGMQPSRGVISSATSNGAPQSPWAAANEPDVVALLPSTQHLQVTRTFVASGYKFMAVDPGGTAYAIKMLDGEKQLWASTDNARTWQQRGTAQDGSFRTMTALADGTLLADTTLDTGDHELARSDDHGVTWKQVLSLGAMSILTPHSIDELDGSIYLCEYQAFTSRSVPIRIWASMDDGRTWQQRAIFDDRRHAHGLRADRINHQLIVFFGDNQQRTGISRSGDGGHTFTDVVRGRTASAVDAVFTSLGLLFGNDIVYGTTPSSVAVLDANGMPQPGFRLPGPSYSVHPTPVGGLLLGTTREPAGDVYLPGDNSAHLLASADGIFWEDVMQFPRVSLTSYGRANVYWTLPSGELVVQLSDVQPVGPGYGYVLVHVTAAPRP